MSQQSTTISGTIKRFRHQNDETGFFIAIIESGKVEQTIVGVATGIRVGERLTASGSWQSSAWGPQLKATNVKVEPPSNIEGVMMFLANSVPGIGKGLAKKLTDALGEAVFDVIENHPEKLKDVPGIGKGKAASIVESYSSQKAIRGVMVFLMSHKITSGLAAKVYQKYGDDSVRLITENPYRLSEIRGIGFLRADEVAGALGVGPDSEFRVRAGVKHVLKVAETQGSCGLPIHLLQDEATKLMNVSYELIDVAVEHEVLAGNLVRDTCGEYEAVFLAPMHRAEQELATRLLRHASRVPVVPVHNPLASIATIEARLGFTLDPAQRDAAELALKNNLIVLTGGPGTGKTTISRVIIESLRLNGMNVIMMCAPTGKAAKRASEATGLDVKTVHRLLLNTPEGKFKHNEKAPLSADVILIDESSMLDVKLMLSLMKAITVNTRVIIIGDKDQLGSVAAGKVLGDILESKAIPAAYLKVIFRQAAASKIKTSAHLVNSGECPPAIGKEPGQDFWHYDFTPSNPKASDEEKAQMRVALRNQLMTLVQSFAAGTRFDPIKDVQVLAPMYKGDLGVNILNVMLQSILNPHPVAFLMHRDTRWGVGDKVMQQRNNYDKNAMNGDVGYIIEVDTVAKEITVEYDDDVIAVYKLAELEELRLAYAFTIHKSQGSEFPIVLMPIDYSHYTMLIRSIVYTGITRAKKLCVMLTHRGALKKAVETQQTAERYTRLAEWLRAGLPKEKM